MKRYLVAHKKLTKDEILVGFKDVPSFECKEGPIVDILVDNNICTSKREAREFLTNGAITINDNKVSLDTIVTKDMAIDQVIIVLRKGKKKYYL